MKFSDIIGNERAVAQVRNMIDSERLPHALLLHGQPGVPKLALARAAAQYLDCRNRHDGDSCGECPSCLQHQSLNHADTFFTYPIVKKGETPVSEDFSKEWKEFLETCPLVEDYELWLSLLGNTNAQPIIYKTESDSIVRKMTMSAYSSRYKVLILWLPEKMNQECANKLLKIIEEPTDDSKFILVSDNAQAILPTIFSRLQRVEMHKPSLDDIAGYLINKYDIDRQDAIALAAPADGNVLQAERNMRLDSETKEFHSYFMALMRQAYSRDLPALKAWSEDIADFKREKSRRFLAYCSRMVRENFIYNLHEPQLSYLTREEAHFSSRFSPFINEQNVEGMMAVFNDASTDIQGNANAKIVLFDTAIKVTLLIKK